MLLKIFLAFRIREKFEELLILILLNTHLMDKGYVREIFHQSMCNNCDSVGPYPRIYRPFDWSSPS